MAGKACGIYQYIEGASAGQHRGCRIKIGHVERNIFSNAASCTDCFSHCAKFPSPPRNQRHLRPRLCQRRSCGQSDAG